MKYLEESGWLYHGLISIDIVCWSKPQTSDGKQDSFVEQFVINILHVELTLALV